MREEVSENGKIILASLTKSYFFMNSIRIYSGPNARVRVYSCCGAENDGDVCPTY